jgi:hypothetical protein
VKIGDVPAALYQKRPQPCCGKLVDAATLMTPPGSTEKVAPGEGDFSVCLYCGAWLRFLDAEGRTRKFDADDILDLTDEQRQEMRQATTLIHALLKTKVPPPPDLPVPVMRRRRPPRR